MDDQGSNNVLAQFAFVDCVVVDFHIHHQLNNVVLKTEAYLPQSNQESPRTKAVLSITANEVFEINAQLSAELWFDLSLPHDVEGSDVGANEVYKLELHKLSNETYRLKLDSDFLNLTLVCRQALLHY